MKKTDYKNVLYFDCFSGISGDMVLGALVDLGVPLSFLKKELKKLRLRSFSLKARNVKMDGIRATKIDVLIPEHKGKRSFREIERIIERSGVQDDIKERSISIFKKMIGAEAKVHGKSAASVHLHEMGAIDAIVDVVGSCIALNSIGADEIISSPINVGGGFVRCDHGVFPVPAPATSEILKGIPLFSSGEEELATPTGAAIITSFASRFIPIPGIEVEKIGYGAGSRQLRSHPNLLRVFLGRVGAASEKKVTVIETTIDDMNPQIFGHLMETLFKKGALEVFSTNVLMKKNRPGILVTVICDNEDLERITGIIFIETTTIGVRFRQEDRCELERNFEHVKTKYGKIRMKVSLFNGRVSQATPEFDDCVQAARKFKVPLKEVQQAAISTYGKNK